MPDLPSTFFSLFKLG